MKESTIRVLVVLLMLFAAILYASVISTLFPEWRYISIPHRIALAAPSWLMVIGAIIIMADNSKSSK